MCTSLLDVIFANHFWYRLENEIEIKAWPKWQGALAPGFSVFVKTLCKWNTRWLAEQMRVYTLHVLLASREIELMTRLEYCWHLCFTCDLEFSFQRAEHCRKWHTKSYSAVIVVHALRFNGWGAFKKAKTFPILLLLCDKMTCYY